MYLLRLATYFARMTVFQCACSHAVIETEGSKREHTILHNIDMHPMTLAYVWTVCEQIQMLLTAHQAF